MTYRLGKKPPRHDDRTMLFQEFKGSLPPAPAAADFMSKVPSWPMFLNDTESDCAEAAMAHQQMGWTWYAGKGIVPTVGSVQKAYEVIGGYVPGDASTDNGSDLLTALTYYRKLGVIAAFMKLKTGNWKELQQSIATFGGVYIGIALPDAFVPEGPGAPDWTSISWVWQDGMTPDPNNGHCIPAMKYGATFLGNFAKFVSWGAVMGMDQETYENASDEAYAIVSNEFIEADKLSPSGFNLAGMIARLAEITA